MLFQSVEFLVYFLPAVLVGFWFLVKLDRFAWAKVWLVAASVVFYSWWKLDYLLILVISVLVNYFIGRLMFGKSRTPEAKRYLIAALVFNIGVLFIFKYFDFFVTNVNALLGTDITLLKWLLPLGISFFTFQNIAYQIDVYEGLAEEHSLTNYCLFIAFFPQLIAGPIVHHSEMMPQFKQKPRFKSKLFYTGLLIFTMGFLKKVGFADTFGMWANSGYQNVSELNFIEAWATSLCYTFQLYFDFSGYSDMAIGIGLMFGITLPENFDSPFRSLSIIEFWQRWHITLTRFLSAYLYTPIVRSFKTLNFRNAMLGSFIAMVLTGLWHGASWTFVAFGAVHGAAIVLNHTFRRTKRRLFVPLSWLLTFLFCNAGFVIFRAESLAQAGQVFRAMLGFNGIVLDPSLFGRFSFLSDYGVSFGPWLLHVGQLDRKLILMLMVAFGLVFFARNTRQWGEGLRLNMAGALTLALTVFFCANLAISTSNPSEFLYFNF